MRRPLGRSSRNDALRRGEFRARFGVELLEHRLALSAAPVAWVELVRELAAHLPEDVPMQVTIAPATVQAPEAPLVARFTAENLQRESSTPLPLVIQWPRAVVSEAAADAPLQSADQGTFDIERIPLQSEISNSEIPGIGTGSDLTRFTGIKNLSDVVFHDDSIIISVDRLPLGDHSILDFAKDIVESHDVGLQTHHEPSDGTIGTPASGYIPFNAGIIPFNAGISNRAPVPVTAFVPEVSTTTPKEPTAIANAARPTQSDGAGALASAGTASPLQSSPVATALGGIAGGQANPIRWLLPNLDLSNPHGQREGHRSADALDPTSAQNDGSIARSLPHFASAALAMVADAPAALGALAGEVGQPANLLGNVTLGTEALDQALASVLDEVNQLGGDLYCWFDEVNVESWARTAAAAAVVGVGGAVAWRVRASAMKTNMPNTNRALGCSINYTAAAKYD